MTNDSRLDVGPCTVGELAELSKLLDDVFIGERSAAGHLFDFAPLLYSEKNIEQLRVVRRDGVIIGHAGILERPIAWRGQVFRAGFIGGVCAREDLRGQGIGTLAMRDAAGHMARMGLDFGVLWTGSHYFY
ncbi:MAG: GNAT family N-acetyltransferase, partial [Armatimonadetes bacterium]|nr:GNAT family N-acetyltransferase [Armatimonadota bacterium]